MNGRDDGGARRASAASLARTTLAASTGSAALVSSDYEEVRDAVQTAAAKGPVPIYVDGFRGHGKTTFSARLCSDLSAAHIEVDKHLEDREGSYLSRVRADELKSLAASAIARGLMVVLDGVFGYCLARLLKHDLFAWVCVAPLCPTGLGAAVLDDDESEHKRAWLLEAERRNGRPGWAVDLDIELVRYYKRYRPHRRADVVYRW